MRFVLLLSLALALAGCSQQSSEKKDDGSALAKQTQTYEVRGQFVSMMHEGAAAQIAHEEIPEVMAAMTMPFRIAEGVDFSQIEPEDKIFFTVEKSEKGYTILAVEKLPADTQLQLAGETDGHMEHDHMDHQGHNH